MPQCAAVRTCRGPMIVPEQVPWLMLTVEARNAVRAAEVPPLIASSDAPLSSRAVGASVGTAQPTAPRMTAPIMAGAAARNQRGAIAPSTHLGPSEHI